MAHSEKRPEPQSAAEVADVVFGPFGRSEKTFNYSCRAHGDYAGHKVRAPGGAILDAPCPDCLAEGQAEKARRDQAEARRHDPSRTLELAGIPKRFQSRTLNSFVINGESQARAVRVCREYADNFAEASRLGRCLIMSGGTGSGKTHLSTAIANQVLLSGYSATFTNVREIVSKVRATWRKDFGKTEEDVVAAYGRVDLLIIDEVGVQFDSDAERLVMFDVINRRYQDVKPTIVISNLPMDAENAPSIRSTLGDRVIDRLRENGGKLITFSWGSYRSSTVTTGNNP